MRALTLVAFALVTALPLASGATTYTYVGGLHSPPPAEYGVLCFTVPEPALGEPSLGGVCGATPTDIGSFTITVQDSLGNPVGFFWVGIKQSVPGGGAQSAACGQGGNGFGSVTLSLADPCARVNVYPDIGTVAGTITVS